MQLKAAQTIQKAFLNYKSTHTPLITAKSTTNKIISTALSNIIDTHNTKEQAAIQIQKIIRGNLAKKVTKQLNIDTHSEDDDYLTDFESENDTYDSEFYLSDFEDDDSNIGN